MVFEWGGWHYKPKVKDALLLYFRAIMREREGLSFQWTIYRLYVYVRTKIPN